MSTYTSSGQMSRHQFEFLNQELTSYRYSSCSCCYWEDRLKSLRLRCFNADQNEICPDCSALQVNTQQLIYWRSRIFGLTLCFQADGHDIISRRKVLPPGECARSVCHAHMQHCIYARSWSIVHFVQDYNKPTWVEKGETILLLITSSLNCWACKDTRQYIACVKWCF